MKVVVAILAGLVLLTCGCDPQKPAVASQPPADKKPAASAPATAQPDAKVTATKEQIGSTVGVRVMAGGLPVTNVTGAILHRQELPANESFFDQHRCVAAYLKGWTEAQLKSEQAKIVIFRNLPDPNGQLGSHAYPGKFLQFDEKSGTALFTYHQGFSAETDLGFTIDRETATPLRAVALRYGDTESHQNPLANTPNQPQRQWFPPITVDEGQMDLATAMGGKLAFPPRDPVSSTDAVLIATGRDSLIGFVSNSGTDNAELVRPPALQVDVQAPTVVPTSATFTNIGGHAARMSLSLERKNGAEVLNDVWILKSTAPASTRTDLKSFAEPFKPIPGQVTSPQRLALRPNQTVEVHLEAPSGTPNVQEITHLLQVGWALSSADGQPSLYSRPFLVKVARNGHAIIATTEGIEGPSSPFQDENSPTSTFQMEAPVARIFEIAEGREVLMQLESAPYWKRFSLEKKTWLPLPPMNAANADLAGNRSSLIVLDRAAREVKRYQLSDLSEAAAAKIDLPGEELFTVRAGCLSDQAPIHVFCRRGPISLDSETLARLEDSDARYENQVSAEAAARFSATGDGVTLFIPRERSSTMFSFRGDIVGLRRGYFDAEIAASSKGAMISGAYNLEEQQVSACAASAGAWKPSMVPAAVQVGRRMSAFPNAPVVARLSGGETRSIPPVPPRLELFSLWHSEPLAALQIPELVSLSDSYGSSADELKHQICVDLQSRRIGILSPDQKTWSVHEFEAPKDTGVPLLQNWPETTVRRGGEFHFVPQHLGKARYVAELLGTKQYTPVTVDEKGISFRIADNELASLVVLNLTLTGQSGSTVVSIPIHVGGVPLPFIWAGENLGVDPDHFGNGFKSLMTSKDRRLPLKTDFYESPDRILEIHSPTSDILAFVTSANRVDLFSLSSRKIVGNLVSTQTAKYYAGNDALYEYDTATRTLTRITVPDGKRGAQLTLPAGMLLNALAIGSQRADPISLFLSRPHDPYTPPANTQNQALFNQWNFATWEKGNGLALLNGETLQPAGLVQPSIWTGSTEENMGPGAIGFFRGSDQPPLKLAGSQNGSVLQLNNHFGVFLPRFSIVAPYPETLRHGPGVYWPHDRAEGSTTGMVVTAGGKVSVNGMIEEKEIGSELGTPCGRYLLAKLQASDMRPADFEVRTIENRTPIFRLSRVAAVQADRETERSTDLSGIQVIRENGPAVIRSRGNKLLQFIDFNIPQMSIQAAPESLHVVSQPHPLVMEGGTYEYQLKVNNPKLVKSLRLRNPLPNTTISPTGLLRMAAPQNVRLTERLPVSIEIETTVGPNLLHQFSVIAVAKKMPSTAPAKGRQPSTPPRRGNVRSL